jgi:hypothetical protein
MPTRFQWLWPSTGPRALAWYVLLTVAFTWPVVSGVTRDLPKDLGDPLLNCWILGWTASHLLRALGGDVSAFSSLWHANIFHPEPYAIGYSELLVAQAVQVLPVYALTPNLILCYNLLFLSTFVLSGLGMFLLARAYLADWRVAFLAGLLFAFTPYRINQGSHLQVMSSQWMPFALCGFHRFIATRRLRPAVGGAVALVAQNLSCGYFLLYFSLFVPPFVLVELARARRWRDPKVWGGLAVAAVLVAACTLPFMTPYFALRDLHGTRRQPGEIAFFSADAWTWLAADPQLGFWGPRLQEYGQPEGNLFPGLLPILLSGAAVVLGARRALNRRRGARPLWSPLTFAAVAALAAVYLSLGPAPAAGGTPLGGPPVYRWLLEVVPGFDGLRVPARFAMIAVLFLSLTAAWGARDLLRAWPGRSTPVFVALVAFWLAEAWCAPLPVNGLMNSEVPWVQPPTGRVAPGNLPPALPRVLNTLPDDAIIVEFPFGVVAWELRHVYYSTLHWRRLVNGFSGYAPVSYRERVELLRDPYADPGAAWQAVLESGTTHVVVHGQAYHTWQPPAPDDWLRQHGARLLRTIASDRLYEVPR